MVNDNAYGAGQQHRPTIPELLDLERETGAFAAGGRGRAHHLVLTRLQISYTRYVSWILDAIRTTDALEHDAELTHRLIRIAEKRTRQRISRTY